MSQVRVINHLEAEIHGRYDGTDYLFRPEIATDIPVLAARHIFGMGMPDKSQAFNQLGWLVPGKDTYAQAMAKLEQISFIEGRTVYEEDEQGDADQDTPQGETPRVRRRTGGRPHVAGPGGEPAVGGEPSTAATPS